MGLFQSDQEVANAPFQNSKTAAAGISFGQGSFGSLLPDSFSSFMSFSMSPYPPSFLYAAAARQFFLTKTALFNSYCKFLCNSIAFNCNSCLTFFDSLDNTLTCYSCNLLIAAYICNLICRCCFGADCCRFSCFDGRRIFHKAECRILNSYLAGCLQVSGGCCDRNCSGFYPFYNSCTAVDCRYLWIAACVFFNLKTGSP